MVDRSPTSAEDALTLGRHSAAEIETARDRVRAYLDERKNWTSLADSVDGFGATGVRLLASDLRVLLAERDRLKVEAELLRARTWLDRRARQVLDEVIVALGPLYNDDHQSWNAGALARKAAADLASGSRTDYDSGTVGALARLVLAMTEDRAELDQMKTRIATIAATLSRAAGMMATDSRDWSRDRSDAWLYGLIVSWECEDEHEHDAVMCGGDSALREVAAQHGWSADDVARTRRFRAALQGARRACREALREMTRQDEADGLLDVGTGFVQTRGDEETDRV